jgi:hypothetical protein
MDRQKVVLHAMEYYSSMKRTEILIHATAQRKKNFMLNKISRHKKTNTL